MSYGSLSFLPFSYVHDLLWICFISLFVCFLPCGLSRKPPKKKREEVDKNSPERRKMWSNRNAKSCKSCHEKWESKNAELCSGLKLFFPGRTNISGLLSQNKCLIRYKFLLLPCALILVSSIKISNKHSFHKSLWLVFQLMWLMLNYLFMKSETINVIQWSSIDYFLWFLAIFVEVCLNQLNLIVDSSWLS